MKDIEHNGQATTSDRFLEYFKTVQGWASVLPSIIALIDSAEGLLPIATVLKPWVYLLIVVLTAFAVWMELSKWKDAETNLESRASMRKHATWHILISVLLIAVYWISGEAVNAFTPASIVARTAELFGLALLIGMVFAEISRAFALLALTSVLKRTQ